MKLVTEYLKHGRQFELTATREANPSLKIALERQAVMYRRRAEVRARQLGNLLPDHAGAEFKASA